MPQLSDLTIHSLTASQLAALKQNLPHAVLLSGPAGVGLKTIAEAFAHEVVKSVAVQQVADEKGGITIAVIRDLYVRTRSKSTSSQVFILDGVDSMGRDAQNAFLKLLEEPNKNIHFILTVHDKSALLPTVLSRVQNVEVKPISAQESQVLLKRNGVTSNEKIAQLLFIASGLPAELTRLTSDDTLQQSKIAAASKAKQFLMGTQYQRLAMIGTLNSKEQALEIIHLSLKMLQAQLKQQQSTTVLQRIDALLLAEEKIKANGHVRTQLLRAAIT